MKKALSVVLAVIIAFSSLAVTTFAAAPDISMTASNADANVGETITVTVSVPNRSFLTAATICLVYDEDSFQLVSFNVTNIMDATVNPNYSAGKAKYVGVMEDKLEDGGTLFTAEFKVLKRGGSISIEAEEIWYFTSGLFGRLTEVTDEVNESFRTQTITTVCPHAEKVFASQTASTCAVAGKRVDKCKECGKTFETALPLAAHNMKDTVIKTATCTEKGSKGKVCTVCGYTTDVVEIPMLSHTTKDIIIKQATCSEKGSKGKQCTVCGNISNITEIAKLPHTTKDVVIKQPTCSEKGSKGKQCTVCGDISNVTEIATLPHNMKDAVIKEATCTEKGSRGKKCTVCGYTSNLTDIPALGHTQVVDKAVAATCTKSGLTEGKHCSVCKAVLVAQRVVPALGHKPKAAVNENYVAPTCVKTGKVDKVVYCSVCNAEISRVTETLSKKAHTTVEYENVISAPTCTKNGKNEIITYCTSCNNNISTQFVNIPALGHDVVVDKAVAVTCTEDGLTEGSRCLTCGVVFVKQEVIPATGHEDLDVDAYCDQCDDLLCDHRCHKKGITRFFWNITNFFNRIFYIDRYCECGAKHY